jgi:cell division protein FtsL
MPLSHHTLPSPLTPQGKGRPQATRQASVTVLCSVGIVLVSVLLYLWPQVRLVNLGYRQNVLQARRTQMLQRQQELLVERATLRQPARIEEIAVRRLGMQAPKISQVIYVRPGQLITSPERAR